MLGALELPGTAIPNMHSSKATMNTKDLAPQRKALVGPAGAAIRTLYDAQS